MLEWTRTIDELGFPSEIAAAYRQCLAAEHGLVIVAGQRQSGLTTTVYAGLLELMARRIVTVEDPIAYPLEGVLQLAVQSKNGFFYDAGIDAARRHDADVIMVGGLFSPETVHKALEAARTRLVIASLFCVRPIDAINQLLDQGAAPEEVEASLLGVFVQELAVKVDYWLR
jgi:type II secretory ATPase GspE/PulE/Tfp pilus assembly ATPase PilB-like protein